MPAAALSNPARLADLKAEAIFFGLVSLEQACGEAIVNCGVLIKEAMSQDPPIPQARALRVIVSAEDATYVRFADDEVLFVESATLAGPTCAIRRYRKSEDDGTYVVDHCYLHTETSDGDGPGDFQLMVDLEDAGAVDSQVVIAHVGLDQIHTS